MDFQSTVSRRRASVSHLRRIVSKLKGLDDKVKIGMKFCFINQATKGSASFVPKVYIYMFVNYLFLAIKK